MGAAYPELSRAQSLIEETLKLEETRFRRTLERGLKILDEEVADLHAGEQLSGDVAFKLYDTYGFPLDLTQDALKPKGIGVDLDRFPRTWSGSARTREKLGRGRERQHGGDLVRCQGTHRGHGFSRL